MKQAHMESRRLSKDSLEYFPTPPWATRALLNELLIPQFFELRTKRVREPCAGGGHMVAPLRERFAHVDVADIHDWGIGPEIRDFCDETPARLLADGHELPHWTIVNPPFEQSVRFFERAWDISIEGVAVFCRLGWLSGQERFRRVFGPRPPSFVCPFSERVALIEGAWDPEASTATDYAWYVWDKLEIEACEFGYETRLRHFRPGMQDLYTRLADHDLALPGEAARRAAARKALRLSVEQGEIAL